MKLLFLLLIPFALKAQGFVGSSSGTFVTAKAQNPTFTPTSAYTGGPTSIALGCIETGCVICYQVAYQGFVGTLTPMSQTPGVCEGLPTTLTYTTPIPASAPVGIVALVSAPGYANSNTIASVYGGITPTAANTNVFLNTPFAPGTGTSSTIVAPSAGSSNCNLKPSIFPPNYALLVLATATSNPTPSSVTDNIQGSAVPYTALGTPVSTGTSQLQFWGHTLSPNNPTIVWGVGTPDYPNGTAICITGYTAVDGTPTTVQSASASSFTLPSITPTLAGELFVAACSDESSSIPLTTASTGWSTPTGVLAVAGQSLGYWVSYKVKGNTDSTAESPVFTSSGNIGASCMMVVLK